MCRSLGPAYRWQPFTRRTFLGVAWAMTLATEVLVGWKFGFAPAVFWKALAFVLRAVLLAALAFSATAGAFDMWKSLQLGRRRDYAFLFLFLSVFAGTVVFEAFIMGWLYVAWDCAHVSVLTWASARRVAQASTAHVVVYLVWWLCARCLACPQRCVVYRQWRALPVRAVDCRMVCATPYSR